jgi:hypothetical protein
MHARFEPDVESGNVVGEIPGSDRPDEIVVLGGHIDSWDIGQGAQDDGVGIMASFEAVSLLHKLGLHPRRTIRVVFWVNEENGTAGAKAYRDIAGPSGISKHVAAIEMDDGSERPVGISYSSRSPLPPSSASQPSGAVQVFDLAALPASLQKSFQTMQQIASLLQPIGADRVFPNGYGTDIEPLTADGVPPLSPRIAAEHYFDWHHSEADTLDKVNLTEFRHNIALLAVTSYILADMDDRLAGEKRADSR